MVVQITLDKDKWVKNAILAGYLIVRDCGTVLRARSVFKTGSAAGTVDLSKGYSVIKQQTHKPTGRVYFTMTWRGFTKSLLTNRVVALRFLPNPDRLPQVNHLDGEKQNNALSNLEWASASQNELHAHRTGLKSGRGSQNSNAKLTVVDVLKIRASTEDAKQIADQFGVSRSTIANIRSGRTWQHV